MSDASQSISTASQPMRQEWQNRADEMIMSLGCTKLGVIDQFELRTAFLELMEWAAQAQAGDAAQAETQRGNLAAENPANYRLAFAKKWTTEQYWEFVEGFTGEWERDRMRDTLAERGLQIVSVGGIAYASPIPRATSADAKAGWRLDFEWLDKLRDQIEETTGYQVTIECVQEAVLRTEALLLSSTHGEGCK